MATGAPPLAVPQIRSSLTAAVMAAALNSSSSPPPAAPNQPGSEQQPGPDILPTPPSSLSPTLSAHKVRQGHHLRSTSNPPLIRIDSDMDLGGGADTLENSTGDSGELKKPLQHEPPQRLSAAALSALSQPDPAGAITPQMLATHHLPAILIDHGPVAIRYVLSYLTQSVPGFARIQPAKARRLVVAALENRGGGGKDGEVVFEKLGWGKWSAHIRGEKDLAGHPMALPSRSDALSPPLSMPGSYAMSSAGELQIPRPTGVGRRWSNERDASGSLSPEYGPGGLWAEHEADKMSLDGHESEDVPYIKAVPVDMGDTEDETEDEDWAAIGAEALRQASLSAPKTGGIYVPRKPSIGFKGAAKSVPMAVPARPQGWRDNRHIGSISGSYSYVSGAGSRNPSRRGSSSHGHGVHPYATSLDQRIRNGHPTLSGLAAGLKGLGSTLDKIPDTEPVAPEHAENDKEREAIEALLHMGGQRA